MRIQALRNTFILGEPVAAGEIVDAPDTEARNLILIKKAKAVGAPKPVATPKAPEPKRPVLKRFTQQQQPEATPEA